MVLLVPDASASVLLLLFRSYAKHGRANVTCEVCKCEPSVLDGYWTARNSQLDVHRLQATPAKECRITIKGV
jgi:hypothetical protein